MTSPSNLRIGDAERDTVANALHDHFAAGRLTREELDERLDTTLAAKTQADLREVVKDLPGPTGLPQPAQQAHPWAHHHQMHRHHRHRHGPPVFPILLVLLIIAVVSGGAGWFIAVKIFFIMWLVTALFAFMRLRRWRAPRK